MLLKGLAKVCSIFILYYLASRNYKIILEISLKLNQKNNENI